MDDAAQAFLKTKIMDNIQVIIETFGWVFDLRQDNDQCMKRLPFRHCECIATGQKWISTFSEL